MMKTMEYHNGPSPTNSNIICTSQALQAERIAEFDNFLIQGIHMPGINAYKKGRILVTSSSK